MTSEQIYRTIAKSKIRNIQGTFIMTDKSALVLVTGGSGFIGFAVIQQALHSGYYVRAAVRRQDAIDRITHAPNMQAYVSSGALSFVIVEDNTSKIAYHEAAKGCSYIIHVASPLPTQPVSFCK